MLDLTERYSRHFSLPMIGKEGQQKLTKARVLCIGAGGLGSPVLQYLAAAGIGTLGIVDDDRVELSNLQRQVIYTEADLGLKKVDCAKARLQAVNSAIIIETYLEKLTVSNAFSLLESYDIVVDCTDNFAARYLINDVACQLKKPHVSASVYQFEGQCSVFTAEHGPCYRCLYPEPPLFAQNCAEGGVLGAVCGLLGTIQAIEVIKLILNIGQPLVGRLLTLDALTLQMREYTLKRNPDCVTCQGKTSFIHLPRYQETCMQEKTVPEITVSEVLALRDQKADFLILDVREPAEYEAANIGGKLIPLAQLPERIGELDRNQLIVVHCRSGGRSRKAVEFLMSEGFTQVKNLKGGITAWQAEVG